MTHGEAGVAGVSVIIPVYNTERYLAAAIESVLAQTEPPLEIVVVDDGSTDNSAAVAEGFGATVRFFRRPHEGINATLNFGIAQARGSLLAFLDADDLWHEEKLALQKPVLARTDAPDIVFAYAQPFVSPDVRSPSLPEVSTESPPARGFLRGTMILSRDAFALVGDFDTTRRIGDFIDWFLRAREAGLRSEMLTDVLLRRRIHDNNTVTREKDLQTDYVKILKASLDRRRKGQVAPGD